ncbi:dihydrodipicolinate synthase family protein [Frigoriglobus tundricola]|uniref:1-pyrroline-4-hydroxy-2-carboxylate deaminase n=1 Tax=Frigoriglobus tundricola TaxID=2774151 RepID=A0A6M5Z104_9BACT|nr:dihydrodipicolinate synthase family protein [Frigoriglobus tundricola]QJW99845.1 1-pyrroline-4-hydroxy-2-carboxylate deaminase [Frigoriglobus tundricola]
MSVRWAGVFPAVTTQFRQDQSLDLAATATHLEAVLASGVSGLVVCGSLGENQVLDPDEKRQVVGAAVRVSSGRVPVVAGVAETSTAAAVRYVRDCERLGAAGFMVMPPMVYKPDPAEAAAYFRAVAAATGRSWMLYNNPLAYTVDVTPERLTEYADIPNLGAIKESSGDPRRVTEIRLALGDRLAVFAGVDDLILESAVLGIDGWVAGSGIAFPAENQRLWELTRAGKWDEARQLYRWAAPLMKLDTHPKFVQFIKLMVQEAGLGAEWVREPRRPIAGAERERVLGVIRRGLSARPALAK